MFQTNCNRCLFLTVKNWQFNISVMNCISHLYHPPHIGTSSTRKRYQGISLRRIKVNQQQRYNLIIFGSYDNLPAAPYPVNIVSTLSSTVTMLVSREGAADGNHDLRTCIQKGAKKTYIQNCVLLCGIERGNDWFSCLTKLKRYNVHAKWTRNSLRFPGLGYGTNGSKDNASAAEEFDLTSKWEKRRVLLQDQFQNIVTIYFSDFRCRVPY